MSVAACIGGGGQAGSRSAGTIYKLNNHYKLIVGTSTGALMATVANNHRRLKEAYTTTENKDIWKYRGVNKKDAPRWQVIVPRLIAGRSSWGDSGNLINLIQKHYSVEDHNRMIDAKDEIVACVWDDTSQQIRYFSNLQHRYYPAFIKYIEASASAPPAMNMVKDPVNGHWLEDGGVREVVPLARTVELADRRNIREVDCFVHSTEEELTEPYKKSKPKNHLHRLMRALNATRRDIIVSDIDLGIKCAKELKVNVNVYYLPEGDIYPRFYFDPALQTEWFNREEIVPTRYINYPSGIIPKNVDIA